MRLFATDNFEAACSFAGIPLAVFSEMSSDDTAILLTNRLFIRGSLPLPSWSRTGQARRRSGAYGIKKDPNILVQKRAWRFLMAETDQKFASDETRKWEQWWAANRTTFTPNRPNNSAGNLEVRGNGLLNAGKGHPERINEQGSTVVGLARPAASAHSQCF